jgi:hypothetical protein
MCFAALDYFYTNLQIPEVVEVDDINLKLFTYLWERQLDSLSRSVILKLFQYMVISERVLNRSIEQIEAPAIRQSLRIGEPVVLALVRVRGLSDPTNHMTA